MGLGTLFFYNSAIELSFQSLENISNVFLVFISITQISRVLSDENITQKHSQTKIFLWVSYILGYGYHSVFTKSKRPHNLETQGNISNSLKRGVIFVTSNPNTHKVKDFIYNMLDPLYLIDWYLQDFVFLYLLDLILLLLENSMTLENIKLSL